MPLNPKAKLVPNLLNLKSIEPEQTQNGFGLFGIIILVAIIASATFGGGMYLKEMQNQKSTLQMGMDAQKRAEELKKQIESRDKSIYGGSTSIDSSAAPTSKNDILSSIPTIEQTKLFTIARSYVLSHSTSGIEFGIVPEKIINNCVRFSVIAKHRETDDAQLFIIKINGVWTPIAFGTAFPNLYLDHPECSESGISNWKTYRNEKYGFEFKYPNNLKLEDLSSKILLKSTKGKIEISIGGKPPCFWEIPPLEQKFGSYIWNLECRWWIHSIPGTDLTLSISWEPGELSETTKSILETFKFIN